MLGYTQFYALQRDHEKIGSVYEHFYKSAIQMRMCMGKEPEPIYLVRIEEVKDGAYYGWKDPDGNYSMIYPSEVQFRICFPYGVEDEEARGRGKAVRLRIVKTGIVEEKKHDENHQE
jgi:hypothetical protein